MASSSDQEPKSNIPNPFLNPIGLWQHFLLTWIEVSKGPYENVIKAYESWLKALCDPWLKIPSSNKKEGTKAE